MNLQWEKNKKIYIGIGLCVMGMMFMLNAMNTKNTAIDEPLTSLYPIKKGATALEKTEEQQGIFSIVTNDLGEDFNPLYASKNGEKIIKELIFEPLALRDADGFYENVLADEIVYDAVEQTVVVTIKEDVKFSDGTPLTIEDVEQSILLAIFASMNGTKYIEEASNFLSNPSLRPSGVQILDDLTIQISFIRYEIENLQVLEIPIQKVPYLEWSKEEFDLYLKEILGYGIGTGSYTLESRNDYLVRLLYNPYFRYDIQDVKIVDVYDELALDLREEFQNGTVDYVTVDYDSPASDLVYEKDSFDIFGKTHAQTIGLYINPNRVMGGNQTVRLVLKNVIDRTLLFTGAYENKGTPATSIFHEMLLPNKESNSMIDLDLVNANFVTLNQQIEQQKEINRKATEVVYVEQVLEEQEDTTEELSEENVDDIPFGQETVAIPVAQTQNEEIKDILLLNEDGEMVISILLMEGNALYLSIGNELKNQLEKYKFHVDLNVVSQHEYLDALYGTGEYDFYLGTMQEISEINDFESLFYRYAWDIDEEMELDVRLLMENLVISESDTVKQEAVQKLTTLIEDHFMFLPLGRLQNFTAISTYWRDYVITPTTFAPQQLYHTKKREE